jgi:hypothetical protein
VLVKGQKDNEMVSPETGLMETVIAPEKRLDNSVREVICDLVQ